MKAKKAIICKLSILFLSVSFNNKPIILSKTTYKIIQNDIIHITFMIYSIPKSHGANKINFFILKVI